MRHIQEATAPSENQLILSVETSGRTGSVALARGEKILCQQAFSGPMRHSAELFTSAETLMNKVDVLPKDISYVCISNGPGSFTGIRIAVTVAKGMAFANNSNIIAVNTLDALAQNASDYMAGSKTKIDKIAAILDAKRGQFFMAIYHYQDGEWVKTTEDRLIEAPEFIKLYGGKEPIWLLGEGLVFYQKSFEAEGIHIIDKNYWQPMAEKVHRLGWKKILNKQFADPMMLVPHYLRGPDAIPKAGLFISQ